MELVKYKYLQSTFIIACPLSKIPVQPNRRVWYCLPYIIQSKIKTYFASCTEARRYLDVTVLIFSSLIRSYIIIGFKFKIKI